MVISISGKIGSGKDTVAKIIQELAPHNNWQIKKFAGKLKQIATLLSGIDLSNWEDQEFKKTDMPGNWGMTYREFLQRIGTDALRNGLHENVWVNSLFSELTPTSNWIITDTRFVNEIEAVEKCNGLKILVTRPNTYSSNHPSETSLDHYTNWDYVIQNNSDLESLTSVVKEILVKEKLLL